MVNFFRKTFTQSRAHWIFRDFRFAPEGGPQPDFSAGAGLSLDRSWSKPIYLGANVRRLHGRIHPF
jgi:hypothetical protein